MSNTANMSNTTDKRPDSSHYNNGRKPTSGSKISQKLPPNQQNATNNSKPPNIQFAFDKPTKEAVLVAISAADFEDNNEPLLNVEPSQSEVAVAEKENLKDLPVVKAYNASEKERMSRS